MTQMPITFFEELAFDFLLSQKKSPANPQGFLMIE
jgi:hypothetical protein